MSRKLTWVLMSGTLLLSLPGLASAQLLGKSLTDWRGELSSQDTAIRRSAAFALGKLGEEAERAIPTLVEHLKDPSAEVRASTATALGEIVLALGVSGELHWRDAGPPLMELLRDSTPTVRRGAAYALGAFGGRARDARDALRTALRDDQAMVRQNAAWALGRLGSQAGEEGVDSLCVVLEDSDALVRRDAVQALGAIGLPTAKHAVRPLLLLVKTEAGRTGGPDPVVLKASLQHLINLVEPGQQGEVAGSLRPLLDHPDADVSRLSALVLANMGTEQARPAIRVLSKALNDGDPRIQELAAAALAQLFSVTRRELNEQQSRGERVVMANLIPEARNVVPELADAISPTRNPNVRRNAALALGHIGPDAKPAVKRLLDSFRPEEPLQVRQYVAEALYGIGYPANAEALPTLASAIRDRNGDRQIRLRCIWAFFNVNDLARYKADEALLSVLDDDRQESLILRYESARVLAAALGENAPEKAVDVLLHMLRNKDLVVFQGTGAKVSNVGTEQGGGKSAVAEQVGGDGRYMAAQALGWMGKRSNRRDVLDALKSAANSSPSSRLAQEATKALSAIQ